MNRSNARLLTPLFVLASGAAIACSSPTPDDQDEGVSLDANGDRVADDLGVSLDADKDGILDTYDIDGDGTPDGVGVDTNGDGAFDAVGFDTDGDGVIDSLDTTGDGNIDSTTSLKATDSPSGDGPSVEDGGIGSIDPTGDGKEETPDDMKPEEDCDATLELILRDFNADHADFEAFGGGGDPVGCGIVMPELFVDPVSGTRTPTFFNGSGVGPRSINGDNTVNCGTWDQYYTGAAEVTGESTFNQWYSNVEGVNMMVQLTIPLTEDAAKGTFVYDSAGTSGFFPLDGKGFDEVTQGHNFHFTTEAHIRFGYQSKQNFTFSGDDDLWIFVNDKLALDLGGLHGPITATIDFDAQASALGITPGKTYNMDIFHAERHTSASNFRVETNISCFETVEVPVVVVK